MLYYNDLFTIKANNGFLNKNNYIFNDVEIDSNFIKGKSKKLEIDQKNNIYNFINETEFIINMNKYKK